MVPMVQLYIIISQCVHVDIYERTSSKNKDAGF